MRPVVGTLIDILQNAEISSYLFKTPFNEIQRFDMGLRMLLIPNEKERYEPVLHRVQRLKPNSLYHLQDTFCVHYSVMKLPDEETDCWLSIGPVLITPPSGEQILKILGELKLPASMYHELSAYYDRIPVLKDEEVFNAIAFSVADAVFSGREHYTVKHIHNSAEPDVLQQLVAQSDSWQEESRQEIFNSLETRYTLENEMLRTVRTGNVTAALAAHQKFIDFAGSLSRMPDRLRDRKDLCITLNTILRKTAEDAGVHPFYIDAFSNANVLRIEQCVNDIQLSSTGKDLVEGYCQLIQQYALSPYSSPVQDALFLIQTDLAGDLSLAALAERLNLNRSYLSSLFCKEVGKTLSAYVLEKRILRAQHLLSSTPLSIQEIAWEVGIPDANYFARLFKRETGMTPKRCREENRTR